MRDPEPELDLYQVQLELERQQVLGGIERYQKNNATLATGATGALLVRRWLVTITEALEDSLSQTRGSQDARQARKEIKELGLPAKDIAYLAIRQVFQSVEKDEPLPKTAAGLGRRMINEVRLREFNSTHRAYCKTVIESRELEKSAKGRLQGRTTDVLLKAQERIEVKGDRGFMRHNIDAYRIGIEPLKVILSVCGEYFTLFKGKKHHHPRVQMTPKLMQWVSDRNEVAEITRPLTEPMVVPPVDRITTNAEAGGYLTIPTRAWLEDLKLLRHRGKPSHLNIKALNIAQRTPWQVNGPVLDVLKWAFDGGRRIANLPYLEDYPELSPLDKQELSPEQLGAFKMNQVRIATRNRSQTSKIITIKSQIELASKYRQYDSIYFPHKFDWRGRLYPFGVRLSPQSDKIGKALLQFSEGKPLGTNGLRWLSIHTAHVFGEDKLSYDDRIKWVEENKGNILRVARNPQDFLWWTEADSPWQFLAVCFEWLRLKDHLGPVESFVSHIPVALDGTCSGLQHFSGLLRDYRGGKGVNLVPSDKPSDIYQAVADEAVSKVNASDNEPMKRIWDGMINRTTCKRGTMTRPYSVTARGMADQLLDLIKDPEFKEVTERCRFETARLRDTMDDEAWQEYPSKDKPSPVRACQWFARILSDSIDTVVVASRNGQQFIVELASVYSKHDQMFRWVTPLGMEIEQGYIKFKEMRVATYFGGTRVRTTMADDREEPRVSKAKARLGASPNYIHSLDATHLMMTVLECYDRAGIESFALIHDSFGVHAGNCDTLQQALRNTFVSMYTKDLLGDLRVKASENLGVPLDELPEVPEMGTLDIEVVRHSPYLFC